MDSSTYDPDKTDTMLTITDSSYYNDEPVTFGPVFFEVLNEMADKVGEMQFLVGLSMQQAPEDGGDDNALLLANASEALLGSRLDAMLLGNVSSGVLSLSEALLGIEWYGGVDSKLTGLCDCGGRVRRSRTCMRITENGSHMRFRTT